MSALSSRKSWWPYLVLLAVAAIRLLWFQGNVLADGDLLIPVDAPGFLGERFSTWNTVELGMVSGLMARLLNPIIGLSALSQIITGSAVSGEAVYLLLFTFLAGVSVWWLTDYLSAGRRSTLSLLVTAIFYQSSMFLINDGVLTSIMMLHTYALIPLIVYLLLRAAKESRGEFVVAASFLTLIIASTMPNFKDLALLAIVLALFFAYSLLAKALNRSSWRVLGKFILYSTLLNLAWVLPVLINLNYWVGGIESLPVTRVSTLSLGLERVFSGIAKWTLGGSHQGLLYNPYSTAYFSPPFVLLGYSLSMLAFASLVLARPRKPALFMASFTLFFLFLTKGSQPPFGDIYSGAVLLGPLRAFRESFHFFQFAALGYAYLIGEFVDATGRYLSTRSTLEPQRGGHSLSLGRRYGRVTVVVAVLVVSLTIVNSWPLHTGEIAVNWYVPDTHGVTYPAVYQEAADWLEQRPQSFRLIFLPVLGNYTAFRWGFQGGSDLFHGLFQQPVIVGSSWSEYAYPTMGRVNEIYDAARTNDTETFQALAYSFSIRFALVDGSRDVAFYSQRPIDYYEDFLLRAGFQQVRQFDFLRLYEYPAALPLVYAADTTFAQNPNSSIQNPGGILWYHTNFSEGWVEQPLILESREEAMYVAFQGNETRAAFRLRISHSAAPESRYLLVKFATNNITSIVASVRADSVVYPYAVNPPNLTPLNHYQSTTPYVLAFPLPPPPITAIELFVTNRYAQASTENLEVWLYSIAIVKDVGRFPQDTIPRWVRSSTRAATLSSLDYDANPLLAQATTPSAFSLVSASRTRHEVRYTADAPFLLVLNEAFNSFWEARVDGAPIGLHIETNDFSNGWLVPAGENRTVVISFGLQDSFIIGIFISLATATLLSLLVVTGIVIERLRNSRRHGGGG